MGYKRHPKKREVDPSSLQKIYSNDRESIIKKADEFSMAEDADVGVLMFSPTGELTTYASKGRIEDMLIRYIEEQFEDSDGSLENKEFLCQSLDRLKFETEKMNKMDRLEALKSKLNLLKYKAEEKMRLYKPDESKIYYAAEADCHQEIGTNALQKVENLEGKQLEEESPSSNRTSGTASTSGRAGRSLRFDGRKSFYMVFRNAK